jgi:GDP/UDP-N,N'-diacetylbacillosamine 2-epimerase (hydrolysing)
VAVITGSRADYGLLVSPMQAIADHPKLELELVVCGMHLLQKFGRTVDQIARDGWRIDARVPMQTGRDSPADQARGLARGIAGIARYLASAGTDVALVLGDRIEALAGALAACTTGRFVAHIHGGDVAPGDFDDGFRHAITKLAHIHLAATRDAARRIVRMGERPDHVHTVGAPGLDRLAALMDRDRVRSTESDRALVVQHPCGRSARRERQTMSTLLRAVRSVGLRAVVIYPNSDRGHSGIIEAIDQAYQRFPAGALETHRSLPRDDYLGLLTTSRVLVGNSSSGIIEAGTAGLPVVNIGPRQNGRRRNGSCVVDCDETYDAIRRSLNSALSLRPKRRRMGPYGRGDAGRRIAEILAATELSEALRRKQITY